MFTNKKLCDLYRARGRRKNIAPHMTHLVHSCHIRWPDIRQYCIYLHALTRCYCVGLIQAERERAYCLDYTYVGKQQDAKGNGEPTLSWHWNHAPRGMHMATHTSYCAQIQDNVLGVNQLAVQTMQTSIQVIRC